MFRTRVSARVVAPILVAFLAFFIGASIAQGNSFGSVDISGVSVSHTMNPGKPFATLTTAIVPGALTTIQLNDSTTLPAAGQVLIYNVDLKVGTKDNQELLTYDNGTCAEGPNQLCITARAKKGTADQNHGAGSIVKLATQLVTPIPDGTTANFVISVTSTAGFPSTLLVSKNVLIDGELFEVHTFSGTTFHVFTRAVDTNPGNPSVHTAHVAGAIITSPDQYIFTMSRQAHNTTTNVVTTVSKPYTFLQPFFPTIPQPFTPNDLENGTNKLKFTAGAISILGTYSTSTGVISIPVGTCQWDGTAADPPTTLVGAATLQWDKNPLNNQTGVTGLVSDTDHSAYTTLVSSDITATMPTLPFNMAVTTVSAVTGPPMHGAFAASGQVLVGAEKMTYDSVNVGANTLHITTRADGNPSTGGPAAVHAVNDAVIQTPVCDEPPEGGRVDAHVLESGTNPTWDSDGDGCSNWNELDLTLGSETSGGRRDPWNPYDFFDPVHAVTGPYQVLVPDILAVVQQYFIDDLPGPIDYKSKTDRTALVGGNTWNLGPPDGLQRVPDILAVVKQYFDACT